MSPRYSLLLLISAVGPSRRMWGDVRPRVGHALAHERRKSNPDRNHPRDRSICRQDRLCRLSLWLHRDPERSRGDPNVRVPIPALTVTACLLLSACLAGCGTTQQATPSPSSSPSGTFVCQSDDYCTELSKAAVLAAVADLGYPIKTVTIGIYGLSCGAPFPSGTALCPLATDPLPTAYVAFVGTDKIAAVEIGTVMRGIDRLVAFEVPPPGWSLPGL
jgi:hypothetical protein